MCEYCNGELKMIGKKRYDLGVLGKMNVYLEQDKGKLRLGMDNISVANTLEMFKSAVIKIKYCPFCGEEL